MVKTQLTPTPTSPADVPDNVDAAHAGAHDPTHWPDNVGSPSPSANDAPPHDNLRCNNAHTHALAQTSAHNPSANNDVLHRPDAALDMSTRDDAMMMGPRELGLPTVKSRGQAQTWLRDALRYPPKFVFTISQILVPRPGRRAMARATARFWLSAKALLTYNCRRPGWRCLHKRARGRGNHISIDDGRRGKRL